LFRYAENNFSVMEMDNLV